MPSEIFPIGCNYSRKIRKALVVVVEAPILVALGDDFGMGFRIKGLGCFEVVFTGFRRNSKHFASGGRDEV